MQHQVIARRFRPQTFKELLGQEALVQTLKNSIKQKRLAHAYLFAGPRGTGKTSVARVLAKAINCDQLTSDFEPCNQCSSCQEIRTGQSLDVIEIDGASNRGIDDIRKINETCVIMSASRKTKIYIIDEVHMLTKEAFNALLKTLEEPPPNVKFFFATTEAHKVLPTIISRCQRFQLTRIPLPTIVSKLKSIAETLQIKIEDESLLLIAKKAEGGLRDAESLFDQIISYQAESLTASQVSKLLGVPEKELFFKLDQIVKQDDYQGMLAFSEEIFRSGVDLAYFLESLASHFRTLLLTKLNAASPLLLSPVDHKTYQEHHLFYEKEPLLALIDLVLKAVSDGKHDPINEIILDQTLLKILRYRNTVAVESILKRLSELGGKSPELKSPDVKPPEVLPPEVKPTPPLPPPKVELKSPDVKPPEVLPPETKPTPPLPPPKVELKSPDVKPPEVLPPETKPTPPLPPPKVEVKTPVASEVKIPPAPAMQIKVSSISIDPTPKDSDLKPKVAVKQSSPAKAEIAGPPKEELSQAKLDTLLHFAAIELEGRIIKK